MWVRSPFSSKPNQARTTLVRRDVLQYAERLKSLEKAFRVRMYRCSCCIQHRNDFTLEALPTVRSLSTTFFGFSDDPFSHLFYQKRILNRKKTTNPTDIAAFYDSVRRPLATLAIRRKVGRELLDALNFMVTR